jgi:hypothetical protein
MANSGIEWIDVVFNWAVVSLAWSAELLGISCEEINVWSLCVVWPALTLFILIIILGLSRENHRLKSFEVPET